MLPRTNWHFHLNVHLWSWGYLLSLIAFLKSWATCDSILQHLNLGGDKSWTTSPSKSLLVGGFNPFETYARQIGSFPQVGVKICKHKKCLKPPPRLTKIISTEWMDSWSIKLSWHRSHIPPFLPKKTWISQGSHNLFLCWVYSFPEVAFNHRTFSFPASKNSLKDFPCNDSYLQN